MVATAPTAELCLVNGVPGDSLPVADRGTNYGDGLFETLRVANLKPLLLDLHLERLQAGLQRLRITMPTGQVEAQLRDLLALAKDAGCRDGVIKVWVSRGGGGRGFEPGLSQNPNVVMRWFSLPGYTSQWYSQGVAAMVCDTRLPHRPLLAGLKHLGCQEYVMAAAELPAGENLHGILLDPDDNLVESTTANLFLLQEGTLFTPSLHRCGVAGTMRRWIMESAAPELGVRVEERDLHLASLEGAEEVFLCNSVFGVVGIHRVASQVWSRGTVTSRIQARVKRLFDA